MAEEQEAEFTFFHRNIENTSEMIHTQQLLSTDGRHQIYETTRKTPHNRVGQKEKETEGIRMGPTPQGGSCEAGKLPAPWEISSLSGGQAWTKGKFGA